MRSAGRVFVSRGSRQSTTPLILGPARPPVDVAFLRAYAHEPRSAKSQKVVLGCVPRTEEVMALFERLQGEFAGAELEQCSQLNASPLVNLRRHR